MQRYSHAAYPNQHKLEENPTGEWVRWEDVERFVSEATLEGALSLQEVEYQFQETPSGGWLLQCSEWIDCSAVIRVLRGL